MSSWGPHCATNVQGPTHRMAPRAQLYLRLIYERARRGREPAHLSRGKVIRLSSFCLASKDAIFHQNDPSSACARAQGSACARAHMAVTHAKHAHIILHAIGDAHAACHAARAHMRRARGRDRLGPGSKEAWPAAQKQMGACFVHAVLPACHGMLFSTCMPHGM